MTVAHEPNTKWATDIIYVRSVSSLWEQNLGFLPKKPKGFKGCGVSLTKASKKSLFRRSSISQSKDFESWLSPSIDFVRSLTSRVFLGSIR